MASNTPIVEDYLEADPPVRGQNYVCLSFISPEKVLKNKEVFKVSKFLEYLFKEGSTGTDLPAKSAYEKISKDPSYGTVLEAYEDWKYTRDEDIEAQFAEKNDFHTTTRGLKIRGVYESEREAKVRAQVLQRRDPAFHVFVGQVGYWLPWDPSADGVAEQEYSEGALNELVKKYKENIQQRDEHYEDVKREKLEKIRKENEEKRKKLLEAGITGQHLHSAEDSKKNVETLRAVVDSADASGVEVPAYSPEEVAPVREASFLEKVADNVGAPVNGSEEGSEQMRGMEEVDPWMRRKMEESPK